MSRATAPVPPAAPRAVDGAAPAGVGARPAPHGARAAPSVRGRRARVLIVLFGAGILLAASPYVPGLLGAGVLYVVCAAPYRWLSPRIGHRTAALILAAAAFVLVLLPVLGLTVVVIEQTPAAFRRVFESDAFARFETLRAGPVDVGAQLARAADGVTAWLSRAALGLVGSATRALLNLLLALVGLYYLLHTADALWLRVRPLIPFSAAGAEALRTRFWLVTEATLLGIAATAVVQGVTVGLGFWIVGLPNPVVWGAATGIVSVLPILGSALVWAPGVVVLAADGRYGAAVTLLAIGLVIASNLDNVVRPIVYRRHSGVHPLATLVGAFAGVELVGLVGLLLGPLAISWFLELVHLYAAEYGHDAEDAAEAARAGR